MTGSSTSCWTRRDWMRSPRWPPPPSTAACGSWPATVARSPPRAQPRPAPARSGSAAAAGLVGLVGGDVCVLLAAADEAAAETAAERLLGAARNGGPPPPAAVGHARRLASLRDAYDEAFYALEARQAAGGGGVATAR